MGCCVNYWQAFDTNAFTDGLDASANHPDLHYARSMLTGHAPPREGIPCTNCRHFEEMRQGSNWITEEEIARASSPGPVAGLLLEPAGNARFAQVSIVKGWEAVPIRQASGRLFRFGVDTAIYFIPFPRKPLHGICPHARGREIHQNRGIPVRGASAQALPGVQFNGI